MRKRRVLAWMAATAVLMAASSGTTWWVVRAPSLNLPASMEKSSQFQRFVDTYRLIRSDAIWHNTPGGLLAGATNGMVQTLHDQFSNYLTASETQSLNQELSPSYVGIGVAVLSGQPLTVGHVFAGSPAARAGIRAGNVIVSVDGRSTRRITPAQSVQMIRGRPHTSVTLVIRAGSKTRRVTLTRTTIALPTVFSQMLSGHIAYMDIAEFGSNTGREAVQQLGRLMRQHPRGIVLDLRDNPGGEVSQALQVANLFVPPGPVVTLKYKNPSQDVTYRSAGPGTTLPVVVLVNGNTASAAEILSAAIQERQGGKLVGTRTYGKGIVQQVVPLPGGASLKLTVARYYTPDGQYIEHVGLTPNVRVVEPSGVLPSDIASQDPQLRAAIAVLKKMMANGSKH